ncbi:hypothetical protein DTO013E5_9185 [Penicillium roqueforti]|nr:hypothetical protein DTO012A1_8721 [Penicillium roqueforti]KAI2740243.1 hypothetical protein DTO013F2_9126 [Penicillium roqueforti]KAI2756329.1 hypothetical protein DTO006G1_7969 [Penicillium roqueforti]KAI2767199.1 hypothetical protein DTO012A8_7589 [Penicillium roqueforti]KAI3199914.1 hypothetical protein DTO013E5_9185 [Penicillium roqueforti]
MLPLIQRALPSVRSSWSPHGARSFATSKDPEDLYMKNNLEKNVSVKDKIVDLGKFIDRVELCMVTTAKGNPAALVSRCMGVAGKEQAGVCLIFHTNRQSTKTDHLKQDPRVNISFLDSTHGEWASLSGDASIVTDKETLHKYYYPGLKAWFGDLKDGVHDAGPDDPRIGIIRVKITQASYAVVGDGMLGKKASEYTKDASDVPRINKLRLLSREELNEWRQSNGV